MKMVVKSANGVTSTFTEEQWNKVKDDPRYSFAVVRKLQEPEEVTEAKASKSAASPATEKAEKSQDKTTQDKTK